MFKYRLLHSITVNLHSWRQQRAEKYQLNDKLWRGNYRVISSSEVFNNSSRIEELNQQVAKATLGWLFF